MTSAAATRQAGAGRHPVGDCATEGKSAESAVVGPAEGGGSVGQGGHGAVVFVGETLVEFIIRHQAAFRAHQFAVAQLTDLLAGAGNVPDADLV